MKEHKVDIIAFIAVVIMILSVFVWNKIIEIQNKDNKDSHEFVDVSDADNVSIVDSKLGEDFRITQSYLLNYTTKKSKTWYQSSAYVKSIKISKSQATITLSDSKNGKVILTGTIDKASCNVKKGDYVNFIGVMELKNGNISLVKISTNEIDYPDVIVMDFKDLVSNFKSVRSTYFIVSGYLVTDDDGYKLYDSKEAYKKDSSLGTYFTIKWDGKFNYTGNQNVKVKCLIADKYRLKSCTLED